MKISLILIGKTNDSWLIDGISKYEKRLSNYAKFEAKVIPEIKNTKNLSVDEQKKREGKLILNTINDLPGSINILLDENGKMFNSVDFSKFIQQKLNQSPKSINFIVGGPYGFSDEVYKAVNQKIAISAMTFSHQMIRLLFVEQLYRAFSILNNQPYHHQ